MDPFYSKRIGMLYKVNSAAVYGVKAYLVHVEVDLSIGKSFSLLTVGLPDAAVKESKERVRAAIHNCGFSVAQDLYTVNLAPANLRKEGSSFDLPMAIGILGTSGAVRRENLNDFLLLGELSLDGTLRPIRGALSVALLARARGIRNLVVPEFNAREAAVVFEKIGEKLHLLEVWLPSRDGFRMRSPKKEHEQVVVDAKLEPTSP